MKYLDYPLLNELSQALSSDTSTDLRVNVRFEAYSIKPVGKEKKAFKEREGAYQSEQEEMNEMSFSPEMREAGLASCFGRLDEKESRKVHFLLVTTLNAAFPDHDFTSLRPDHFTREPSASQVLAHLSGSLLGPSGAAAHPIFLSPVGLINPSLGPAWSSPSASPASSSPNLGPTTSNPDLYRMLSEVVPLEDCHVYSWFPEPEYDPHIEPDDESSDDEDFPFEEDIGQSMDLDGDDIPASWGGAGMDLDVDEEMLESVPMARQKSTSGGPKQTIGEHMNGDWDAGRERRVGGLLWSANYFFYSKRQKRVLFLTCWCRNHPTNPARKQVESTFPAPISASFSSPSSSHEHLPPLSNGLAIRNHRYHHHSHHHRKKTNVRTVSSSSNTNNSKSDQSSTIPIRGMGERTPQPATPRANRLATSAPSTFSPLYGVGTPNPIARMTAGGFKPRQTPARVLMNAQAQAQAQTQQAKTPASTTRRASTQADGSGGNVSDSSRIRRERSGSSTPGPATATTATSALTAGLRNMPKGVISGEKGKRVKV